MRPLKAENLYACSTSQPVLLLLKFTTVDSQIFAGIFMFKYLFKDLFPRLDYLALFHSAGTLYLETSSKGV